VKVKNTASPAELTTSNLHLENDEVNLKFNTRVAHNDRGKRQVAAVQGLRHFATNAALRKPVRFTTIVM